MYNYHEALRNDIRDYIEHNIIISDYIDRYDLEDDLEEAVFISDSVTGNGSGSYTFNSYEARKYVGENMDLLSEALAEFCTPYDEIGRRFIDEDWEYFDVTIRCYLVRGILCEVLDEMEEDGLLNFDEE